MAMGKLGGIACCCGECCTVTDNFNRADSGTIGGGWVETSGTWDIVSNKLSISGTGTITETTCDNVDGDGSGRPADFEVSVVVRSGADNVVVKVGMHDLLAVLTFAANTVGFEGAVTSCTTSYTLASATDYTVQVIWQNPHACIKINGAMVFSQLIDDGELVAADPTLRVTTNPTPTAVTFDDYTLKVHDVNVDCISDCDGQPCTDCATGTTPRRYQVVIAGVVNGACATSPNCAAGWNRTFILEQCWCRARSPVGSDCPQSAAMLDPCIWGLGFTDLQVFCDDGAGGGAGEEAYLKVGMGSPGTLTFQDNLGFAAKFDHPTWTSGDSCAFDGVLFDFDSASSGADANCDFSSATCTVTAL